MADTNFTPGTLVQSSWLNDVNRITYDLPKNIGAGLIGTTEGWNLQTALNNRLANSALSGAIGTLAGRSSYNNFPVNFQYLAADTGNLYYRTGASGNWAGPFPFGGGNTTVGTTTTGLPGTNASVTNSGTPQNPILNFTIPRGDKGDQGDPGAQGIPGTAGAAATINVGTTTTGAAGSSASVTNSGTTSAAVFNFTIPRGDQGIQGVPGTSGAAATVTVGTTTTGAPGTNAIVTNSGTSSAAILNFTIPRGDTGSGGGGSGDVVGPASAVNNNMAVFDGTTGKLIKDGGAPLVIGTTATTAKAGNYQPAAANISDSTATGRSVLTAANAAAARTAIGAGTSNLTIGTTSTTAKAGDYQPTIASQATAEAGTNNTEYMTPLRTAQAITARTIGDAPADGTTYGRKDNAWVAVTGGGGGTQVLPILGSAAASLSPASAGGHIANLVVQISVNDASSVDFGAATNGTTTVLRPNVLAASTACYTSTDMRTWTQRAIHAAGNWRQYAWDGSNFLAFGIGSTLVSRSPTGTTWAATPAALPANPSNSGGQGKATGLPSTPGTALIISQAANNTAYLTTNSGGTWSTVTLPATLAAPCLYKAGGLFILVNGTVSSTYYTSPTGATGSWTTRTAPSDIRQIIVGASNDRMIAVGSTEGNLMYVCDDAVNWVATTFARRARAFGLNLASPLLLGDVPVYPTAANGNQVFTVHGGRWVARENTISVAEITPTSPMLVQGTVMAWSSGNLGSLTLLDLTASDVAQGTFGV